MKDSIITQCLDILKTPDVRNEIKILFSPVTDLILYEIYPYIYVIIFLVFLIFICLTKFNTKPYNKVYVFFFLKYIMGQSRKINRKSPRHNKRTTKRQHGGSDSAWSYVLNQVGPLSEQLSRTFSTTGDNLAMSQSNVLSPKTNINAPDPSSRQIGASMTGDIPKQSGGKRRHKKNKKSKKSKKKTKKQLYHLVF